MNRITAKDSQELKVQLSELMLKVPKRSKGRKTPHTEFWTMSRFLSSYADSDLFTFPLTIFHRDKPDFQITENNKQTGIEITESIPEIYAYVLALAEKHFPKARIEPSMFLRDSFKRNKSEWLEILKKSQDRLVGLPVNGDKIEQDWAEWIFEDVTSKTKKLNSNNYEKFIYNFLLIYDNLPHVANDIKIQLSYLKPKMHDYWKSNKNGFKFENIFIISEFFIFDFTNSALNVREVVNLW
jgi:hypothetical protein